MLFYERKLLFVCGLCGRAEWILFGLTDKLLFLYNRISRKEKGGLICWNFKWIPGKAAEQWK